MLWDSFQSWVAYEKIMRLYSYAMHSNSVLFDTFQALRCVLCANAVRNCGRKCVCGLVTHVYVFDCDEILLTLRCATTTLYRNRCKGVLRLVVQFLYGFRSIYRQIMPSVIRFALGNRWKDSNSGRTGLDLGLVCDI